MKLINEGLVFSHIACKAEKIEIIILNGISDMEKNTYNNAFNFVSPLPKTPFVFASSVEFVGCFCHTREHSNKKKLYLY